MKYFEEIDAWLAELLGGALIGEDDEQWFNRVSEEIKDKLLESYRNGQKAGLPPAKSEPEAVQRPKRRWPPRKPERQ